MTAVETMSRRAPEAAAEPFRPVAGGIVLFVRLTPKAAFDRIEPPMPEEPHLKARVRAAPEDGKANIALVRLIADWLGLPPTAVSIKAGATSRLKQVLIAGDGAPLASLLRYRINELEISTRVARS